MYSRVEDIEHKVSSLKALGVQFDTEVQAVCKDVEGLFGNPGDTEYMAFFKDPTDNTLALAEPRRTRD
ncbi:MAG: hypothetical protein IIC60_00200 [Proteobacteria bacterium]|nr:hypothetical protein [Pseudomonadota bacterium]